MAQSNKATKQQQQTGVDPSASPEEQAEQQRLIDEEQQRLAAEEQENRGSSGEATLFSATDRYTLTGVHDFGGGLVGHNGQTFNLPRSYVARFPGKFKPTALTESETRMREDAARAQAERHEALTQERQAQNQAVQEANDAVVAEQTGNLQDAVSNMVAQQEDRRRRLEARPAPDDAVVTALTPKSTPPLPPGEPAPGSGVPGPAGASVTSDVHPHPH